MSCNCGRQKKANKEYEEALKMASIESKEDHCTYVIYELKGKIYYDKFSCWQQAKDKGKIKEFISSI